jgi:hypothetical protein
MMKRALLIPLVMLLVSSCKEEEIFIKFSHSFHVEKNGIECVTCHEFSKDNEPKRAKMDECRNCHEINEAKPGKECLLCHAKPDYEVKAAARAGLYSDVKFQHKPHLSSGMKCEACHGDMKSEKELKASSELPKHAECFSCHEKRGGKAADCSTCHKTITKSRKPKDHGQAWTKTHGRMSRATPQNCAICHDNEKCISCHRDEKPANHKEFWARKEHGLKARYSRENCTVCHTEDSCTACHAKSPPSSHRTGWAQGSNLHCNSCHLPLESTNCYVCHKALPANNWHQ